MRDEGQRRDGLELRDELDILVDAALATYADPGPASGLEDRVFAGLAAVRDCKGRHAAIAMRRGTWLWWAVAGPVAACLLLLWFANGKFKHAPSTQPRQVLQPGHLQNPPEIATRTTPPETHQQVRDSGAKARSQSEGPMARLKPCPVTLPDAVGSREPFSGSCSERKRGPVTARNARLPKLNVFPAPRPLSAEEQALAEAASNGSDSERRALEELRKQPDAPLNISHLYIPPLVASDEGEH